ncbi:helix-turn-helix domain-containing protein [Falsiroseomonas selenitidurans]|uniref:Helix-turn-helix transcriptional regulator n=1 Tax=Falsiroseomonas selenitidurans TaxID=2716335 RepID=A0ABX1E851_9PROT|nr:helix-turn-helix transcriptional regulator [Falsiroseomonas selenitidurans]NKC33404.1 helix-turn-helix transcriptional regulator [Falsiroseomonas selenitidurans]
MSYASPAAEPAAPFVAASKAAAEHINVLLGQRVRELRKLRRMSQSELAVHLDVSFQQVQKYEQGTNRISVSSLLQIAQALKVRPDVLLGEAPGLDSAASGESALRPVAEQVRLLELFDSIADAAWRAKVLDLVELLGTASRRGA